MNSTLIITPTYNEKDNLRAFVTQLFDHLPSAHLLIVDDNSPDGTGVIADDIAKSDARVRVMHRTGKLGLGTAYLQAFEANLQLGYEFFIEMDADLSHHPKYLKDFMAAFEQGADVVIGSRNIPGGSVEGWGPERHFISKGGSLYSRTILGVSVRDLTSGYKGFRKHVLESIPLNMVRSEGYSFQIEMTYRAIKHGFKVKEVPIIFYDRTAGKSKMSKKIFLEAIQMVWKLRFSI